jgi:GR25 family glycosyltransferase involved in LPS biosynthesis
VRCRFINLDRAVERRSALEQSFAALAPAGWSLDRFPALCGGGLSGPLSLAEKGCFASHREVLRSELDSAGPVLILEDDACLSVALFSALPAVLGALGQWDLLFTEAAIGDPNGMANLAAKRQAFARSGDISVVDLSRMALASSSAYVVNEASKAKLLALLPADAWDVPFDLFLRRLIARGDLKAFVVAPYLSTVSGAVSQIACKPSDAPMALFRQVMFIDRDEDACERASIAISSKIQSIEARLVGTAFAGVLDAVSRGA